MTRALVLLLAGCGRIGFAPSDVDAADHDAAGSDAADDVFVRPFGPPQRIPEIASAFEDDDPSMTADGLELYFGSARAGTVRTFRSIRASPSDPWSAPTEVTALGPQNNNPRVSYDGLAIYFSSDRAPSEGVDIWRATRPSRELEFGTPERVVELSTPKRDFEPAVATTQSAAVLTSDRESGDSDLFVAERRGDGSFASPVRLALSDDPLAHGSPWLLPDGLHLVYHRELGGMRRELLYATRSSMSEPFGAPTVLVELDTPTDDQDPWLSPDGRTILFASDRDGNPDIYIATR